MGWTLPGQCMCIPWDVVFCTCRNMRCMCIRGGISLRSEMLGCVGICGVCLLGDLLCLAVQEYGEMRLRV